MKNPVWDAEKVAALKKNQIETLLENARKRGVAEVMGLCESELAKRRTATPVHTKRTASAPGDYVAGYHFVCARDRGVTVQDNGMFSSGSWKVSRAVAELSLRYGAYIALHESKDLDSYRQGQIVGFIIADREMVDKENLGIEFIARTTSEPRKWVGAGSGEKGYLWTQAKTKSEIENEAKD
jgi:hypothetical protein